MNLVHRTLFTSICVFLSTTSCERFAKVSKLAGDVGGASCSALEDGNFTQLELAGSAQTRVKVLAFLESVHRLKADIAKSERAVYDLCVDVALQTGTSKAQVKKIVADQKKDAGDKPSVGSLIDQLPEDSSAKLSRICSAALQGFKKSGVKLQVSYSAPQCSLNVDGFAQCLSECGAPLESAKLTASCKGKLSGACTGKCQGECEGTANDTAESNCEGVCRGECSGKMSKLSCQGDFSPPVVNASCHAACSSQAETQLECSPATAELQITGASAALEHDLRGRLPLALDVLLTRSKRILATAENVASAGAELKGSLSDAGSDALTCVAAAVAVTTSASISFQGSLRASADIKGMASNPL